MILAVCILGLKPIIFGVLLQRSCETKQVSFEVGVRLGQSSEFSLLVAYLASTVVAGHRLIGDGASYLIQATTILTFVVSSYWVVLRYPTPIALSDKLRRD